MSTTRFRPTICDSRPNAQLIDFVVCDWSVFRPPFTASVMTNGSSSLPGFGSEQGLVPSSRSLACAPAWTAAARMNTLMLDPVWRGASAMLTSRSFGTNPRPPTITRMAPLVESSDTIDASKPWNVSGSTARA